MPSTSRNVPVSLHCRAPLDISCRDTLLCDICHQPKPRCFCNVHISSSAIDAPASCPYSRFVRSTDIEDNLAKKIFQWYRELPVFANDCPENRIQREDLIRRLIDNIERLEDTADYDSRVKEEIMKCVNSLPIWFPGDKRDQTLFKEQIAENLYNRLMELDESAKLKALVAELIGNLELYEDNPEIKEIVYSLKNKMNRPVDELKSELILLLPDLLSKVIANRSRSQSPYRIGGPKSPSSQSDDQMDMEKKLWDCIKKNTSLSEDEKRQYQHLVKNFAKCCKNVKLDKAHEGMNREIMDNFDLNDDNNVAENIEDFIRFMSNMLNEFKKNKQGKSTQRRRWHQKSSEQIKEEISDLLNDSAYNIDENKREKVKTKIANAVLSTNVKNPSDIVEVTKDIVNILKRDCDMSDNEATEIAKIVVNKIPFVEPISMYPQNLSEEKIKENINRVVPNALDNTDIPIDIDERKELQEEINKVLVDQAMNGNSDSQTQIKIAKILRKAHLPHNKAESISNNLVKSNKGTSVFPQKLSKDKIRANVTKAVSNALDNMDTPIDIEERKEMELDINKVLLDQALHGKSDSQTEMEIGKILRKALVPHDEAESISKNLVKSNKVTSIFPQKLSKDKIRANITKAVSNALDSIDIPLDTEERKEVELDINKVLLDQAMYGKSDSKTQIEIAKILQKRHLPQDEAESISNKLVKTNKENAVFPQKLSKDKIRANIKKAVSNALDNIDTPIDTDQRREMEQDINKVLLDQAMRGKSDSKTQVEIAKILQKADLSNDEVELISKNLMKSNQETFSIPEKVNKDKIKANINKAVSHVLGHIDTPLDINQRKELNEDINKILLDQAMRGKTDSQTQMEIARILRKAHLPQDEVTTISNNLTKLNKSASYEPEKLDEEIIKTNINKAVTNVLNNIDTPLDTSKRKELRDDINKVFFNQAIHGKSDSQTQMEIAKILQKANLPHNEVLSVTKDLMKSNKETSTYLPESNKDKLKKNINKAVLNVLDNIDVPIDKNLRKGLEQDINKVLLDQVVQGKRDSQTQMEINKLLRKAHIPDSQIDTIANNLIKTTKGGTSTPQELSKDAIKTSINNAISKALNESPIDTNQKKVLEQNINENLHNQAMHGKSGSKTKLEIAKLLQKAAVSISNNLAKLNKEYSSNPKKSSKDNVKANINRLVSNVLDNIDTPIDNSRRKELEEDLNKVLLDQAIHGKTDLEIQNEIPSMLRKAQLPEDKIGNITKDLIKSYKEMSIAQDSAKRLPGQYTDIQVQTSTPRRPEATLQPRQGGLDISPISFDPNESTTSPTTQDLRKTEDKYTKDLINAIQPWADELNLDIDAKSLANEIIDRKKYLQFSGIENSPNDEAENLKYDVFKWLNKFVDATEIPAIMPKVDKLISEIRHVLPPQLIVDSDSGIDKNRDVAKAVLYEELVKHLTDVSKGLGNDLDESLIQNTANEIIRKLKHVPPNRLIADSSHPDRYNETTDGNQEDITRASPGISTKISAARAATTSGPAEIAGGQVTVQGSSGKTGGASLLPTKKAADILFDNIEDWTENLPIKTDTPQEIDRAKKIKQQVASKLIHKIGELNLNPEVFNDDYLYEDLLDDEIENILSEIPDEEIQQNLPSLKTMLKEKVREAKQKTLDENAGPLYRQQLREAISKTLPIEHLTADEQAQFEVIKDSLADAFINLHYIGDEEEKNKYKTKINNEINKFCDDYLKRNPASPINTSTLNHDLYNALKNVSLPKEEAFKNEVQITKMKDGISDWVKELPLPEQSGKEQLQMNKMVSVLSKKLYDIEKEKEFHPDKDYDDLIKKEVIKWLKKVPLRVENDEDIKRLAEKLTENLKDTEKSRRVSDSTRSTVTPDLFKVLEKCISTCQAPCSEQEQYSLLASTLSSEDQSHLSRIRERSGVPRHRVTLTSSKDASVNPLPIDAGSQTNIRSPTPSILQCPERCFAQRAPGIHTQIPSIGSQINVTPHVVVKEYYWDSIDSSHKMPCSPCSRISLRHRQYYENAQEQENPNDQGSAKQTLQSMSPNQYNRLHQSLSPIQKPLTPISSLRGPTESHFATPCPCPGKPSRCSRSSQCQSYATPQNSAEVGSQAALCSPCSQYPPPCQKRFGQLFKQDLPGVISEEYDAGPSTSFRKPRVTRLGSFDRIDSKSGRDFEWAKFPENDFDFWDGKRPQLISDDDELPELYITERREEKLRCRCQEKFLSKCPGMKKGKGCYGCQSSHDELIRCSKCCGAHCPYPSNLFFNKY